MDLQMPPAGLRKFCPGRHCDAMTALLSGAIARHQEANAPSGADSGFVSVGVDIGLFGKLGAQNFIRSLSARLISLKALRTE